MLGIWCLASILYSITSVKQKLKLTTNMFLATANRSKQNQSDLRFVQLAPLSFTRPKGVEPEGGGGYGGMGGVGGVWGGVPLATGGYFHSSEATNILKLKMQNKVRTLRTR